MLKDYDWLLDSLLFCGKIILCVAWCVFTVIVFKIIKQLNFSNNRNTTSVNFDCKNYELHVEKYIDEDDIEHTSYTIRKILYEDEDEEEENLDAVDTIKRSGEVE